LKKYHFFFYPAQFWAHKNHVNLINAFERFVVKYPNFKLVLTGSDKGNLEYVKRLVEEKGLMEYVVFPGFVPQEYINTFYTNAAALTMVSYFGPTNMPPLEAMELGCMVIASNLAGHREQMGDSAIYVDPLDVLSIEVAMEEVLKNRGTIRKRQVHTIFTIQSAMEQLNKALGKAVVLRSQWTL
jgi:glycosyltransferase involved in cell wall biosynthesis